MLRLGLLLFYFLLCFNGRSQFSGYTFCDWDKIKFQPAYSPSATDTAIVFVSVRNYFPEKTEFMDYEFDSTGALHYFTIYFSGNRWVCVPRKNLQDAFEGTVKTKDAVVYGEGMGKDFTANIDRATRLSRLYNVTTVMFDWPTYRPYLNGGKNYKKARLQSTAVSKSFCQFLKEIDALKSIIKSESVGLSLLLHSLGNRLIKEAVINNFISESKLFDNVVLNAPCVKMRQHRKWLEKLNIQNKIYLTRNNKDRTLLLAKLAGFTEQLGRRSALRKAKNAVYLNFSPILEREHNYFLMNNVLAQHPEIKSIYTAIFHKGILNFDDQSKFINERNGQIITLKRQDLEGKDINIGISIGAH